MKCGVVGPGGCPAHTHPRQPFGAAAGDNGKRQTTMKTSDTDNTAEARAAATVLQKPYEVTAGGRTYRVARPTPATLIEVSRLVKTLPSADIAGDRAAAWILGNAARHYPTVLRIAATLICGVRPQGLWGGDREIKSVESRLRHEASNEEVWTIISSCLSYQQIGFFLNNIISLGAANVTSPTRTSATAHGE